MLKTVVHRLPLFVSCCSHFFSPVAAGARSPCNQAHTNAKQGRNLTSCNAAHGQKVGLPVDGGQNAKDTFWRPQRRGTRPGCRRFTPFPPTPPLLPPLCRRSRYPLWLLLLSRQTMKPLPHLLSLPNRPLANSPYRILPGHSASLRHRRQSSELERRPQ